METEYVKVNEMPIEVAPVPNYTDEEHGTWSLLIASQNKLVAGRACDEFIKGLRDIHFSNDRIPKLKDVSQTIEFQTGWKLMRVDGLVHPNDFFSMLARKFFPSTDFIRKRSELKYTPAPDMFHDLFGHAPLLTNPDFCEFFQAFGEVAMNALKIFPATHEIHNMITRIYWFTVEFGLIATAQGVRAYGSGSCSSPEELEYCVTSKCEHIPFDVEKVSKQTYDIWHLQEKVFVIKSFPQLGKDFRQWSKSNGIY